MTEVPPAGHDRGVGVGSAWLTAAAVLDLIAALLHLACIAGGPGWYRFFGAGERMVHFAERGSIEPAIFALAIAAMLTVWAAYALSGAGLVGRLPFVRQVLLSITAIYLIRAAALPLMLRVMTDRSTAFLVWSSAIVLVYGIVHAIGLARAWHRLG